MDPLLDVLSLLKPRSYSSGGFDVGEELSIQFPRHEGIKCYAVAGIRLPFPIAKGKPAPINSNLLQVDSFLISRSIG